MSIKIAPSLLSADFGDLKSDIEMINGSNADYLHIDIMDGVFVPNISFGFPVLDYVKELSKKPLDVHLMITNPTKFITEVKQTGAQIMNIHLEASKHLHSDIELIKSFGMKAGVTLNPATPVLMLEEIIADLDMVIIMSGNLCVGWQKFLNNSGYKGER